jgi:hypothetical protein
LQGTETENDRNGKLCRGDQKERDARQRAIRIYRPENFRLTRTDTRTHTIDFWKEWRARKFRN